MIPARRVIIQAQSAPAPPAAGTEANVGKQQQSADAAAAASSCPFLAAMSPPPTAAVPWYQRLMQFKEPPKFQGSLLASHDIVQTPAQMGFPALVVPGTAEMVKEVLNKEGDLSTVANFFVLANLLGPENIGFIPAPRHKYYRNLLAPAFSVDAVNGMVPDVTAVVTQSLERWADSPGPVQAYDGFKRMTFEVITNIMLGKAYSESKVDHLHKVYGEFSAGIGAWPFIDLPFTRYGKAVAARRFLLEENLGAVAAGRAKVAAGEAAPGVLGTLLAAVDDEGNGLTDTWLAENLLGLLFAGHDTTSSTLTGLLFNLHQHPHVMERIREEQRALAQKHGGEVTPQLLKSMKYADAVVREQLRHSPIADSLYRSAARDFEMGGHKVEAGTMIYLPLHHLTNQDPRWQGATGDMDPTRFNPDRWLTPAPAGVSTTDFAFGHGPRFCLGYHLAMCEAKVFLAVLARGYSFTLTNPGAKWTQLIGKIPEDGLPTIVTRVA